MELRNQPSMKAPPIARSLKQFEVPLREVTESTRKSFYFSGHSLTWISLWLPWTFVPNGILAGLVEKVVIGGKGQGQTQT